jgi:hypothetical protein
LHHDLAPGEGDAACLRVVGEAGVAEADGRSAERWTSWQGVGGEIDARPGGDFQIRMGSSSITTVVDPGGTGGASPSQPQVKTSLCDLDESAGGDLARRRRWPSTTEMAGSATSTDCASEPKAATLAPTRRTWKQAAPHLAERICDSRSSHG